MTCSNCKFWDAFQSEENKGIGVCRRYPPQITTRVYTNGTNENAGRMEPEVESSTETEWPETCDDAWCGEFKIKF